jgi:ABC-type multidrug transport system ATPase subunit
VRWRKAHTKKVTDTVSSSLHFAAVLRLPETFSREAKIARAEEIMTLLGLKDVADIKVGGELVKGISGGEKRRLSLAVERKLRLSFSSVLDLIAFSVINNPNVLLVDEPSSGRSPVKMLVRGNHTNPRK